MGLARWPIAYSGHCARRFVWKTCISVSTLILFYLFSFHYTLIYIPNNSQAMMRMMHVSFLANMSFEFLTNMCCHACLMQCVANTYVATCSTHMCFWHFFKPLDRVSKNACNDSVTFVRSFLVTFLLNSQTLSCVKLSGKCLSLPKLWTMFQKNIKLMST